MKPNRLVFIDVLRGIAVTWMIETHVVHIGLASAFKSGWLYNKIYVSNGFVAVGFIFCAGAGFWLAAASEKFSSSLGPYLRRLGFILIVAYTLNLPVFSLRYTLHPTSADLLRLVNCDILHAIVFSSLLALLIYFLVPRLDRMRLVFAGVALLILGTTPLVWAMDPFASLPAPLAALVSRPPISKFPLFPWMAYFFAGAAVTGFFMQAKNKRRFAIGLAALAWITFYIVFFVKNLPFTYPGYNDWGYSSPGHAFYRLSGVVFVFALLYLAEEKFGASHRVNRFFQLLGQESLLLYVGHLMIIYGTVAGIGLRYYAANALTPLLTFIVTLFITVGGYVIAKGWHDFKTNNSRRARVTLSILGSLLFILFILNPL